MFWFFKKKKQPKKLRPLHKGPFKLERFADSKMEAANDQLTDGYVATGAFGVKDLLAAYRELREKHPDMKVVTSLDDFQASYTSFHSVGFFNLDATDDVDLSRLPRSAFDDDGEYLGEVNTPEEFFIREANFRRQLKSTSFDDMCALMTGFNDHFIQSEFWDDVKTAHKKLDGISVFHLVPVTHAYETLIAFPNGYFDGDLTPFENHELARHLEERTGLTLFGIGSTYLAFTWEGDATDHMLATLQQLSVIPDDEEFCAKLKTDMNERNYVLINYTNH